MTILALKISLAAPMSAPIDQRIAIIAVSDSQLSATDDHDGDTIQQVLDARECHERNLRCSGSNCVSNFTMRSIKMEETGAIEQFSAQS